MNDVKYKEFLKTLNENLSPDAKNKIWKKILSKTFKALEKKLDKENNKRKRKKMVKKGYENASDEYHKKIDNMEK